MSVRPKSDRHQADLRLGPLQLPAGSAHARPLRASQHRARHARVRGQLDRLHGDALRARARASRPGSRASAARRRRRSSTASSRRCSTRWQMMHAANFLHRDIAPDNIIVRADGTPGAARLRRRAAGRRRDEPRLTGIVKAGYSPHEQYATRQPPAGALVGPLCAGRHALSRRHGQARPRKPPCASTKTTCRRRSRPPRASIGRASSPASTPASRSSTADRPQSVAQLRADAARRCAAAKAAPSARRDEGHQDERGHGAWPRHPGLSRDGGSRSAAAMLVVMGGAYGGYEYMHWQPGDAQGAGCSAETRRRGGDCAAAGRSSRRSG